MKLIIQIPCYNEQRSLPRTLVELPRSLEGFDEVEWLVVDDGSTDDTATVARRHGADHVVRHISNMGLARAFMTGLEACLDRGADVIVNTDADNQYRGADIPKLVAPILEGRAEIVVGARPIAHTEHFSWFKKLLQRLGSWVVRRVSNTRVEDAPSGFRAISRRAALQLNVFNEYTYTLETIIQAGHKGLAITSVPIGTNADLRPSRLVRSVPVYVLRSVSTIVRIFMTYKPFHFFAIPGLASFAVGLLLGIRFMVFYWRGEGQGHVQSVILSALLLGTGAALLVVGLVADLISANRKLLEKVDWRSQTIVDRLDGRHEAVDGAPSEAAAAKKRHA